MERLGYRPELDGLRGVAILLVVAFHAYGHPSGGFLGVDVFFVLSGFLITTLLLEERQATGRVDVVAFYLRRGRRLLPALAVLLVVVIAADWPRAVPAAAASAFYISNIVRASGGPGALAGPLGHLWSLAQEEQFYLFWPALLPFLLRTRKPALWIAAGVAADVCYTTALVASGAAPHRIYFGPDTHAYPLLFGCLLAFWRPYVNKAVGFSAVTAAAVLVTASVAFSTFALTVATPIVSLASVAVVASCLMPGPMRRCLGVRPLVSLGRISYSLYLWHQFILQVVHPATVALVVAVVVASCSYRFVEQPLRRKRPSFAGRAPMSVAAAS